MTAALLLAALLQAAPLAAGPSATPAVAPTGASGVLTSDSDTPTQEGLDDLLKTYHDSCEQREYGMYDDMCSAMADQIRQYRAALAKASRKPRPR